MVYSYRAWISIDNKLFLWDLSSPADYTMYDGISDVIVSVALTTPKPNMFLKTVEYFLIVATTVEVLVLALSWDDHFIEENRLKEGLLATNAGVSASSSVGVGSSRAGKKNATNPKSELKVLPTKYVIPTDSVTIVKVLGTSCGRIFLAGVDGNMHEIIYDYVADTWMNQILGFAAAAGDDADDRSRGSYKVQKLTHSTSAFQLVNLLPDFIKGYAGYIDSMSDVVIDDVRHAMYGITVKGRLNVFYLGLNGHDMQLCVSGYDIIEETIRYLRYGSKEGMPTSEQLREGARTGLIEIVGLHVVPLTESKQVHLVLVLSVGIRVYVSVKDQNNGRFCHNMANIRAPVGVDIVHVRSPPAAALLSTLKNPPAPSQSRSGGSMLLDRSPMRSPGSRSAATTPRNALASPNSLHTRGPSGASAGAGSTVRDEGSSPRFAPHDALQIHTTFYGHGLFVSASADGKDAEQDYLCGISEDLVARNAASQLAASVASDGGLASSVTVSSSQQPGMRETVNLIRPNSSSADVGIGGKVYDIKEVCNDLFSTEASRLHTMIVSSKTPAAAGFTMKQVCAPSTRPTLPGRNRATSVVGGRNGAMRSDLRAVPTPYTGPSTTVIPYASRVPYTGLTESTSSTVVSNMVCLSEHALEMAPSICPVSTQRRLYCLTNKGLHVVAKSRPIDYLYNLLSSASGASSSDGPYMESLREFFQCYGSVEASAMCVAVACSTPFDVTGGYGGPLTSNSGLSTTVDPNIRRRTVTAMQRLSDVPSFQTISQSRAAGSLFDSRITNHGSRAQAHPDKTFRASAVHEGLQLFLSRTLRPIWLKPIVENNQLSSKFSPAIVKCIREPLISLLGLFKEYYGSVITAAIVEDRSGQGLLTAAGGGADDEAAQERVLLLEARRLEEASLGRMCRLVSRCIHALNTLEVISEALQSEDMKMINSAEVWSRFAQVDFYSFVCSAQCHAAAKDCIRGICDRTVLLYNGISICDKFVGRLSDSCYLYYAGSDKLSYEAVKLLAKLEELSQNDAEETKFFVDESVSLLLQQALYWDNVEDVLTTTASSTGGTATKANNLWYNCEKLRVYGSTMRLSASLSCTPTAYYEKVVDAIVDMCLISCNHFYGCIVPNSPPHYTMSKLLKAATSAYFAGSSLDSSGAVVIAASAPYEEHERAYYRGGAVDKLSDAQIISAKDSCYACLWHNIRSIKSLPSNLIGTGSISNDGSGSSLGLGSVRNELVKDPSQAYDLVLHMLTRICTSTDDVTLHKFLYSQLCADNEKELLVELESNPFLDDYLRQVDPVLLYKNYEHHQRFSDAADLMVSLATDQPASAGEYGSDDGNDSNSAEGADIYQRLEFLAYAIHSGSVAVSNPSHDCSTTTAVLTIELVDTMSDQLTVASKFR